MADMQYPVPVTGCWDTAVLGPVAEVNEQLLATLRGAAVPAPAAGAVRAAPRLLTALSGHWRELDAVALHRLAGCPYLLLDAGFASPARWERPHLDRVMDAASAYPYFGTRGGVALVRRTLVLAWHLARSNLLTARIMLGMSAACAERIAGRRLADLEALAELGAPWIVPRWEQRPQVWRQMIGAACSNSATALRQVHLRGLQLIAAATPPG